MRILYGVTGEGMGHAIRSSVVLEHLFAQGHEVEILASNRAAKFLDARFPEVHRIHGFTIVSEQNRVRRGKTLWENLRLGALSLPQQIRSYYEVLEDFRPEAVITDFETFSWLFAKRHRLPVISLDNMQVIHRCELPKEITKGFRADFKLARALVKAKVPGCLQYLIATFFHPPIRKKRTAMYPPVLRRSVLNAERRDGDHLLVYQTSTDNPTLVAALQRLPMPVRIYGMRRDLNEDVTEANLTYRPFSEETFVDDLASAQAVVASAGFTLMGEAVYLGKPMLAVPLGAQFEQVLNARYLEHLGFGAMATELDAAAIQTFLGARQTYSENLASFTHDGNASLLARMDGLLASC